MIVFAFRSKRIDAWLAGTWSNTTVTSGYFGDDCEVYPEPTPVAHRRRDAMEVVEFELVEVPISGSNLPKSSRLGNRIHAQKSGKVLRDVESGNGNSIFSTKELSV